MCSMKMCQVWQHLSGADADRRGGEQRAAGRTGNVATGAREGEGLHHHHRDAGEGRQEGQGVLKQNKLLTVILYLYEWLRQSLSH